ncbi:cobalamin biosynthesis protein CobD/CbiB [Pantoea alhagi]|uniref:Yip1 family protein n=1 Tax=Mixta sp. BE291 TaxID=3158787 RepID=UPI002855F01B|nr:cobalamin biosynthesis protein CobD/CbiB [Pantoea alhagi]
MNHVWGLLAHPNQEMRAIERENESVSHHYTHHVLLMAAIPVICSLIGTTQMGWYLGGGHTVPLALSTGLMLAVLFYLLILGGVAVMGRVIHWMARDYPQRPSIQRCTVFAGYVATPLFLSGVIALYPVVWLCVLAGAVALAWTGYLLYVGIPQLLNIDRDESLRFSGSTLAIGILLFEVLLALTVLLWGYGSRMG